MVVAAHAPTVLAVVDYEVLISTKNERLLLTCVLDQGAYDLLCRRPDLGTAVRARLTKMARTGQARPHVLLERLDLSEADVVQVARYPSMDADLARLVLAHRSSSVAALAELSVAEARRSASRVARGMSAFAGRHGQVLGVLRNTSTLTRMAAILIDEDVAGSAGEVAEVLSAVERGGPVAVTVFLELVKTWRGSAADLAYAVEDLARG